MLRSLPFNYNRVILHRCELPALRLHLASACPGSTMMLLCHAAGAVAHISYLPVGHAGTTKRTAATSTRATSAARTLSSRSGTTSRPRPAPGCMQGTRAWKRACAWVEWALQHQACSQSSRLLAFLLWCGGQGHPKHRSQAHCTRGHAHVQSTLRAVSAGSSRFTASQAILTCLFQYGSVLRLRRGRSLRQCQTSGAWCTSAARRWWSC